MIPAAYIQPSTKKSLSLIRIKYRRLCDSRLSLRCFASSDVISSPPYTVITSSLRKSLHANRPRPSSYEPITLRTCDCLISKWPFINEPKSDHWLRSASSGTSPSISSCCNGSKRCITCSFCSSVSRRVSFFGSSFSSSFSFFLPPLSDGPPPAASFAALRSAACFRFSARIAAAASRAASSSAFF